LCYGLLRLDVAENKNLIVGTHMLRKTAFLLSYWGIKGNSKDCTRNSKLDELDEASILLDARHKDIFGTKTYLGDSGTLKALMDRSGMDDDPLQKVGRYNPIYVEILSKF
jgi:hypothetical protein